MKPSSKRRMTAGIALLAESATAKKIHFVDGLCVHHAHGFLDRVKFDKIAADSPYEEIHYATQTRGSCEEHHWRRTLAVLLKTFGADELPRLQASPHVASDKSASSARQHDVLFLLPKNYGVQHILFQSTDINLKNTRSNNYLSNEVI